ncbi:hypothetical protein ACW4TU_18455 [Streptomyces sp. QTS52]
MILGLVASAIKDEIAQLNVEEISPGMTALALSLARAVDSSSKAPTAKAVAARELRAVMAELRKLAPVETKGDVVDDIAERRAKRRAGTDRQSSSG